MTSRPLFPLLGACLVGGLALGGSTTAAAVETDPAPVSRQLTAGGTNADGDRDEAAALPVPRGDGADAVTVDGAPAQSASGALPEGGDAQPPVEAPGDRPVATVPGRGAGDAETARRIAHEVVREGEAPLDETRTYLLAAPRADSDVFGETGVGVDPLGRTFHVVPDDPAGQSAWSAGEGRCGRLWTFRSTVVEGLGSDIDAAVADGVLLPAETRGGTVRVLEWSTTLPELLECGEDGATTAAQGEESSERDPSVGARAEAATADAADGDATQGGDAEGSDADDTTAADDSRGSASEARDARRSSGAEGATPLAAEAAASRRSTDGLARTGEPVTRLVALATLLGVAGAGLLVASRRHPAARAD